MGAGKGALLNENIEKWLFFFRWEEGKIYTRLRQELSAAATAKEEISPSPFKSSKGLFQVHVDLCFQTYSTIVSKVSEDEALGNGLLDMILIQSILTPAYATTNAT